MEMGQKCLWAFKGLFKEERTTSDWVHVNLQLFCLLSFLGFVDGLKKLTQHFFSK
jgi:hypothetical protein